MEMVFFSGVTTEFCPSKVSTCSIVIRKLQEGTREAMHRQGTARAPEIGVRQAFGLVESETLRQWKSYGFTETNDYLTTVERRLHTSLSLFPPWKK